MTPHLPGTGDAAPAIEAPASVQRATLWRYGLLGAPLAFVALPLYVTLPSHYASQFGMPLAVIGLLLLLVRAGDALIDPWLGSVADRWLRHSRARALWGAAAAAVLLALGFVALFFPATTQGPALLAWCTTALAVTYLGYSVMSLVHQAWGSRLGGDPGLRAAVAGWREAMALVGVLVASMLPSLAGLKVTCLVLGAGLIAGLLCLASAPYRKGRIETDAPQARHADRFLPWRQSPFRRLMGVYLVNGIASAMPATLVLFYIRDRLQAPAYEALFLVAYFAAGALSVPLWLRSIGRFGLARSWVAGMALSVMAFVTASGLGAGDVGPYLAVCIGSGLALGADLAIPGALLTGVIQRSGHAASQEGLYLGWWNGATKLNLALAAGLSLPALQALGYQPGVADSAPWSALVLAYCLLPCILKLAAAALLFQARQLWNEDA